MNKNMEKQVDREHYAGGVYLTEDRFASYSCQISEVLSHSPSNVLEVGVGDKVLGSYLKSNTSINYTSVDIAEDLKPDVVGGVTALPFPAQSFDLACAFEVLEHLPFEKFEESLSELNRVSRKTILLSLPHFGPSIRLEFKIPFIPRIRFAWKVPVAKKHVFNGEHYWEIGKRGYPVRRIRASLEKFFIIRKEYVPFGNQYHHFFVLEKKTV